MKNEEDDYVLVYPNLLHTIFRFFNVVRGESDSVVFLKQFFQIMQQSIVLRQQDFFLNVTDGLVNSLSQFNPNSIFQNTTLSTSISSLFKAL